MCTSVCECISACARMLVCLVLFSIQGQRCSTLPWVRLTWGVSKKPCAQETTECYHSKPLGIRPGHLCFLKASQVFPTGNQGGESVPLAEILKSIFLNKSRVWFPALTWTSCQNLGMKWCPDVCFSLYSRMGLAKISCFPAVLLGTWWFLKGIKRLRDSIIDKV